MSLRVWLPLTKDLRNQGLDNVTVTNNGATFNSAGKLGGCYYFNATSQSINLTNYMTILKTFTNYSISAWVYIETKARDHSASILSSGNWNQATGQLVFGFYSWSTDHYTKLLVPNTSGWSNGISYNFMQNTWYHITITYNGSKTLAYVNGIKIGEYNGGGIATESNTNNLYVGCATYYGSFNLRGKLNDVRIYDHCLSPMEVKELAKGLVLHYPLNRQGWGQENLFNWSNNAIGITLNDYQNKGSFTQFTNSLTFDPSTTVGKKYTISFWAKSPNGTTPLQLYNANSNPKYFYFSTTLTSSLGTEWQFFKYTVTNTQYSGSGTASTNTSIWKRIEIYAPNQMKVQVKQIKVEEGEIVTPWCPNSSDALATTMGLNETTEYDCSGYCNNGTRIGTFNWTSNTPKYAVSQVFNGIDNAIQTPSLPTMITDKNYTIAVWIYKTVIGSKGYQTIYGGPSGFEIEARNGSANETKFVPWNWGKPMASYELNEWNHCVFVHSDSDCKIYLNGEYIATGTAKASNPTGNYFIGAWNTATQQNFDGLMSDFRIYATALSASDVKSLYQNCATIDPDGTIRGQIRS